MYVAIQCFHSIQSVILWKTLAFLTLKLSIHLNKMVAETVLNYILNTIAGSQRQAGLWRAAGCQNGACALLAVRLREVP